MSNWARLATQWMRKLGSKPQAKAAPPTDVLTGAAAAFHADVLAGQQIFRALAPGETRLFREERVAPSAFGTDTFQHVGDDAAAVLSAAVGAALGGQRATVLLESAALTDAYATVLSAAARRAPLLVQAVTSADAAAQASYGSQGHGPYHALTHAGAILAFADGAQQVVDKSLVSRRVAEQALLLAVVAMDGPETAWGPASVHMPSAEQVREYLGDASDSIACPTPEQQFLFGDKRSRVPRWFDADRPAAHGMLQSGRDLAVALAGQRAFAATPLLHILQEALNEHARLTGRRLELISEYQMDRAEYAFVGQGMVLGPLRALVDYLREERGERVGVVGIEWLRPLDAEALRASLAGLKGVAVLERTADWLVPGGPLLREIEGALLEKSPPLWHAVYGAGGEPVTNAELLALFEHMKLGAAARREVVLGVAPTRDSGDHPKRQAFLQRLDAEFPNLERETLAVDALLDLRPPSAKTIALWGRHSESAELDLEQAAQQCVSAAGGFVKSRVSSGEQGTWTIEISSAREEISAANSMWHDAVIVAAPELPAAIDPLSRAALEARVLLSSPIGVEQLWGELPATWRNAIVSRQLDVYVCNEALADLLGHIPWLLGVGDMPAAIKRLDWRKLPPAERAKADVAQPLAVRRFSSARKGYDNLPRFWSEFAAPRRAQGGADAAPDPFVSLAAVPPSTSGLFEVAVHRNRIPDIMIDRCTGCGACWTACPDAAIMPALISVEALLGAAADQAQEPGAPRSAAADKLRRAFKQLSSKTNMTLAKTSARFLDAQVLREGYAWLVEQLKVADTERPDYDRAFEATLAVIEQLPFAVTEELFHRAQSEKKDSGQLLGLSVNPAACQGCGGCSAVCAEQAISVGTRSEESVQRTARGFSVWERLPDPAGATIAWCAERPSVGPMAAVMTSRHTLLSVAGGGGHEPGSGARIAARLITAVAEFQKQRGMVSQLRALKEQEQALRAALQKTLTSALPSQDLEALDAALQSVPDHSANVAKLVSELDKAGHAASLDSAQARRWVALAKRVSEAAAALEQGRDGMGRARFGLVVASPVLAEWAAEFPRNPFAVPVVVELSSHALDLAVGLAEGQLAQHASMIRLQRYVSQVLEAPAQADVLAESLSHLGYEDLTAEELASCPATLVLAGPDVFSANARAGLFRLLASRLPVKIAVLDGRERWLLDNDPVLPLLMQRKAMIASCSIAHRDHLFEAFTRVLAHPGPALCHVYSPSPGRHGFESADTVSRARAAVDCRVHPLFLFDPSAERAARLDLQGNPDPNSTLSAADGGRTPAHFALGERRFLSHFAAVDGSEVALGQWLAAVPAERRKLQPSLRSGDVECRMEAHLAEGVAERLETWETLQGLASVGQPVAEPVTAAVGDGLENAVAALRAEYEAKMAALRAGQLQDATTQLRERFMTLAGYAGQRKQEPS
ncbi:MAG: 4Fe-4S binding protein [Polyangiaceae bacterium]